MEFVFTLKLMLILGTILAWIYCCYVYECRDAIFLDIILIHTNREKYAKVYGLKDSSRLHAVNFLNILHLLNISLANYNLSNYWSFCICCAYVDIGKIANYLKKVYYL